MCIIQLDVYAEEAHIWPKNYCHKSSFTWLRKCPTVSNLHITTTLERFFTGIAKVPFVTKVPFLLAVSFFLPLSVRPFFLQSFKPFKLSPFFLLFGPSRSVYLSIHLSVCLSVCCSVCLSACILSLTVSLCLPISVSDNNPCTHSYQYLFRHLLMNIDAFLVISHFFQFSHESIKGLVH